MKVTDVLCFSRLPISHCLWLWRFSFTNLLKNAAVWYFTASVQNVRWIKVRLKSSVNNIGSNTLNPCPFLCISLFLLCSISLLMTLQTTRLSNYQWLTLSGSGSTYKLWLAWRVPIPREQSFAYLLTVEGHLGSDLFKWLMWQMNVDWEVWTKARLSK